MREPKNGEWWLCERGGVKTVFLRKDDEWRSDERDNYSYCNVTPLFKMTEDKSSDCAAVSPRRTRTEYEKVKYSSAWKAAKDHEERKVELWRKSDLNEAINGNNWKAIQSPSEAAQYHFDLYRKVEKEIDERQEFVKEASKIWNRDDMHCSTDIFREMYDSGKFKFIG